MQSKKIFQVMNKKWLTKMVKYERVDLVFFSSVFSTTPFAQIFRALTENDNKCGYSSSLYCFKCIQPGDEYTVNE